MNVFPILSKNYKIAPRPICRLTLIRFLITIHKDFIIEDVDLILELFYGMSL